MIHRQRRNETRDISYLWSSSHRMLLKNIYICHEKLLCASLNLQFFFFFELEFTLRGMTHYTLITTVKISLVKKAR